ncbi:MAG: C1 family peptidase, partial [Bacillota bacterium]|nr:C1 family peptidase [Bacillota bacterium]
MKFKRILTCALTATILLSNLIPLQGIAAPNQNNTKIETQTKVLTDDAKSGMLHGVKEPSAETKEWAKKNMKKIKAIKPNKVGLDRIKKVSPNINMDKVVPADIGDELSTESQNTEASPTKGSAPINTTNSIRAASASTSSTSANVAAASTISTLTGSSLPNYVDNSQLDCFPPIRDQGGIGSCAAFSTTYYQLTHMTGLALGWNTKDNQDNTNKMSPKWTYDFANYGYDSGSNETDIYRILQENGCATWSDFPYSGDKTNPINYTQICQNKAVWENAFRYRIKECGTVPVDNVSSNKDQNLETIKNMLVDGYVLSFACMGFDFNSGYVMNDPSTSADDSFVGQCEVICMKSGPYGHQMTIVGYNDDIWIDMNGNGTVEAGEKGAFRVADSYLNSFNNGFYWLSYDSVNSTSSVPGFIAPPSGRTLS